MDIREDSYEVALKSSTEVVIPKSLIVKIIGIAIRRIDLGYISLTEFIKDAINFIKQRRDR